MDNEGRLYSQVAAQAGVTPERAMVACYLSNLSKAGKTMDEAATLLRKQRCDVREYARDWGISFVDYSPAPQPLRLEWVKPKRGRWELKIGDAEIAEAITDGNGCGSYMARRGTGDWHYGSSAEIAIRRLSEEMERDSVGLFGVDDVVISMQGSGRVAPKEPGDAHKLAAALG